MSETWKPGEHTARRGLPGDPEQDGLAIERLLFHWQGSAPSAIRSSDPEEFAAAPDAGGGVEGHCFLARLAISGFPRFAAGDDHPLVVPDIHLLQLPDLSFAQAVAGLVFETQGVVLGGEDAERHDCGSPSFVVRLSTGKTGTAESVGSGGKKAWTCITRAERDVPEIRRCAMIADDAVREHGEGMRDRTERSLVPLHTDAAAAIGMIHEDKFAPVGVRLFQAG